MLRRPGLSALLFLLFGASTALAGTVYSSFPTPLPQNLASMPFEAAQTSEFGGLVRLGGASGPAPVVSVLMSSWGCESGDWTTTCATAPGATFSVPITLRVYARGAANAPGSLLATQTKAFAIPYRPSSDPACASSASAPGGWTANGGVTCSNGMLTPITFDPLAITLPTDVIITLAYNTTHYGSAPIGEAAPCFTSSGGCGYDSLNVGLTSPVVVGAQPLPDDAYLAATDGPAYCDLGAGGTGVLRLDAGCWTDLQPNICVETAAGGCTPVLAPYDPPAPPAPPAPPPTTPPGPSVPASATLRAGLSAPSRVTQGGRFGYTITITNTSANAAQSVVARLTIPKGVTLVSIPRGARLVRGVLVWSVGALGAGQKVTLRAGVRLGRTTRAVRVAGVAVGGTNVTTTARASTSVRVRIAGVSRSPAVVG